MSFIGIACMFAPAMFMSDGTQGSSEDGESVATMQPLLEGTTLPDVVLFDMNNQPVHLSRYAGKRLLICTWASW